MPLLHRCLVRMKSSATFQQGMQDDGTEGGGPDAPQGEAAHLEGEVACAQHQRDRCGDQVAVIREIDLVDDPNAGTGDGDQAKHQR